MLLFGGSSFKNTSRYNFNNLTSSVVKITRRDNNVKSGGSTQEKSIFNKKLTEQPSVSQYNPNNLTSSIIKITQRDNNVKSGGSTQEKSIFNKKLTEQPSVSQYNPNNLTQVQSLKSLEETTMSSQVVQRKRSLYSIKN